MRGRGEGTRRALAVVPLLFVLLLVSCESDPVLFPPAVSLEPEELDLAGAAGARVDPAPVVRALDENGNGVPGVEVEFTVQSGGGVVSPAVVLTDGTGRARPDEWRLGAEPGMNELVARLGDGGEASFEVSVSGGFSIDLRFLTEPDPVQQAAFESAAQRWESVILGNLPPVQMDLEPGECGANSPAFSEVVDDVVIFVTLEPIDGVGGIIGQAGPCWVRTVGSLPIVGLMILDSDDLEDMAASGLLETLVLHEMAHVLGLGTMWQSFDLLRNPSLPNSPGVDTHFDGPEAIAAFDAEGGAGYTGGARVPVENAAEHGPGTRDSHWRISVFGTELMVGVLSRSAGAHPMSRVTIASLADLGYEVDLAAADPFSIDAAARLGAPRDPVHLGDDIYTGPIGIVDESGRVLGRIPGRR